jgi:hypothetical protein
VIDIDLVDPQLSETDGPANCVLFDLDGEFIALGSRIFWNR